MKSFWLSLFFVFIVLCGISYGFEVTGIQPVDPYGVFSTFSAESLPQGKVALSAGSEVSIDPDFYRFVFKSAYGITDNLEILLTVPYVFGNDITDGFEDPAFGLKHRFFDEGRYGPSLAYVLNASLPSGRSQLSTDGRYGLGLVISKRIGPVNGHLNLFYEKAGSGEFEDDISFLAGLDFAASHNFKFLAELYCKKSHASGKLDSVEGRLGYRFTTTDFIYTTFGAGFDLKNRNPETRIIFTVTFLSPAEKKKIKKIYEEE